jgi:chloramphenicol 3-O-phosphotransferase
MVLTIFKKIILILTPNVIFMHSTGNIILLYGTGSAGKSSISKCLEKFFVYDAAFVSVDEISWKPLIEQAKKFNLINDSMTTKEQFDIMMQHMDMLDSACSSQWIVHLKQFYDKVKRLAITHRYVIVDTVFYVDENIDTKYFLEQMKDIPIFAVLVYAAPNILAHRIVQRNTGLIHEQKRDVIFAMSCFYDLYRPVANNGLCLLRKQDVADALQIIQSYWLETGMPENLIQEKITFLQDRYHKTFFLNETDCVDIAPRFTHDIMIDTGQLPAQKCAQLIYEKFMDKISPD